MLRILQRLFRPAGTADPFASLRDEQRPHLRLVIGLGNPGPRYAATRHNIGFQVVDVLSRRLAADWVEDHHHGTRSLVAVASAADPPLVLAKPLTYMNLSGETVARLRDTLSLDLRQLLVVYDDMDLPFGTIRLRERGSAGTHNGMRSIIASLEADGFARLRCGIGHAHRQGTRDYVLGEFTDEERAHLAALTERAADAALTWAREGAATAMNRYNG